MKHHVALSVVGADRIPDSGYLLAKVAQERIIPRSPAALKWATRRQKLSCGPEIHARTHLRPRRWLSWKRQPSKMMAKPPGGRTNPHPSRSTTR